MLVVRRLSRAARAVLIGVAPLALLAVVPLSASAETALGPATMYKLPSPTSEPQSIAVGPDGALWFTERNGNRIGRITTSGAISEIGLAAGGKPVALTTGADGNIWFTDEAATPSVSRLALSTHLVTPFPLSGGSRPEGITTGEDGDVWFTEAGAESIARVTPSGTITPFKTLFSGDQPSGITRGRTGEGNVWYTGGDQHIGYQSEAGGTAGETTLPNATAVAKSITLGPNSSDFWFTEDTAVLGHIFSLFAGVSEFPALAVATDVITGPDGDLWYTDSTDGIIVRALPNGTMLDFLQLPKESDPDDLVSGPDGAVWFTDPGANAIGRIAVPPAAPLPTGPEGPAGATGPAGLAGAAGPAGPSGHLVIVAYQTTVTKAHVSVSFALTDPAQVTLAVAGRKGNALTVAQVAGQRGVNHISWNRRLAGKHAAKGAYHLTLQASVSGSRSSTTLNVKLR